MSRFVLKIATAGLIASAAIVPAIASADYRSYQNHRQQQQNTWKAATVGAAAVGLYGLIKGDKNLTMLGAAGALYSGYRYEQDRKNDRRYSDRYGYYDRYQRYDRNDRYDRYDRYDNRNHRNDGWKQHGNGHAYGHYKR